MRLRSLLAPVLLVVMATAASAQDYSRVGLYAGLNGVAAFENFDGAPSGVFDTAIGASGRLGYRFAPAFSIEGQVEYSGDFADCCGVDFTSTLVTINGKYYVLQDQIQPYLLAGIGGAFMNADSGLGSSDENSFVAKFGGGVDFYLTSNIALELEAVYNVTTGDLDDARYTSLGWGVVYHF